jgi:hypothetical protein
VPYITLNTEREMDIWVESSKLIEYCNITEAIIGSDELVVEIV